MFYDGYWMEVVLAITYILMISYWQYRKEIHNWFLKHKG